VFARASWYLYELLTGNTLDIEDVPPTGTSIFLIRNACDGAPYRAGGRGQRPTCSARTYCPLFGAPSASRFIGAGLGQTARALVESCEPSVLARAVNTSYQRDEIVVPIER